VVAAEVTAERNELGKGAHAPYVAATRVVAISAIDDCVSSLTRSYVGSFWVTSVHCLDSTITMIE
jgi:hypothetical protein